VLNYNTIKIGFKLRGEGVKTCLSQQVTWSHLLT